MGNAKVFAKVRAEGLLWEGCFFLFNTNLRQYPFDGAVAIVLARAFLLPFENEHPQWLSSGYQCCCCDTPFQLSVRPPANFIEYGTADIWTHRCFSTAGAVPRSTSAKRPQIQFQVVSRVVGSARPVAALEVCFHQKPYHGPWFLPPHP